MKRIALFVCLIGALFFNLGMAPSYAAEVDVLINKLVEKGLLSQQEAGQLLKEMQKEGARQETTVKETAEKVAKETAQKTVKEESQTWAKVPGWVNRIHFKGDFRLRYQYEDKEKSDGTTTNRNRGRYRWRFGAVADVTEDKKWQVGFGLSSGGTDPRSTNQTFDRDFETPDARIDYAYAQFQPFKEWKIIGGQFKNPIYQTKDLVWDGDIRPQGIASPLDFKINDQFGFFLNPALFVLQEFRANEETAIMFVFQPGVTIYPTKATWIKLAGTWYWNSDVEGNSFAHSAGTNSTDANGNLLYNYSSIALDGEVGFKFNSYIQHAALFGQFIKSDADNDDTGWLAGFKFGRSVKDLGDWELKYNYRRLEKDAVLDFLPDSDFYGGDTNVQGHEVELKFGLAKHVYLALDYYRSEKIDYAPGKTNEPENLFQFDVNFKF
ncbi:MAG: putative porin [Deltaproteobacteria bacterium]|nr:putative porin [Deltaproteobacteria bacterium]